MNPFIPETFAAFGCSGLGGLRLPRAKPSVA